MIQDKIHSLICAKENDVESWFCNKKKEVDTPFYTSVDVRDSGHKIVSVDANIYPAGFNNICPVDKENAPEIVERYVHHNYGSQTKKIMLLSEEHTKNAFYWENVRWIVKMLKNAKFDVRVGLPSSLEAPIEVPASSGDMVPVSAFRKDNGLVVDQDGFVPDLIISNNDFSNAYETWAQDLKIPINPPRELGWHQRKKSEHFKFYNNLAKELCDLIGIDPWILQVETHVYPNFDVNDMDSRNALAERVDELLKTMSSAYKARGIQDTPSLFIKNNSGTYGLGVMKVSSAEEVRQLNSKSRSKLNASKGGKTVTEVILQEGVPTIVKTEGIVSEPVIYFIGCELAGGFFRTHSEKGPDDSLNSPGAVFKKMCVSDLKINQGGCPIENVYGWVAKLSSLAIGYEAKALGLKIGNPNKRPGCA